MDMQTVDAVLRAKAFLERVWGVLVSAERRDSTRAVLDAFLATPDSTLLLGAGRSQYDYDIPSNRRRDIAPIDSHHALRGRAMGPVFVDLHALEGVVRHAITGLASFESTLKELELAERRVEMLRASGREPSWHLWPTSPGLWWVFARGMVSPRLVDVLVVRASGVVCMAAPPDSMLDGTRWQPPPVDGSLWSPVLPPSCPPSASPSPGDAPVAPSGHPAPSAGTGEAPASSDGPALPTLPTTPAPHGGFDG